MPRIRIIRLATCVLALAALTAANAASGQPAQNGQTPGQANGGIADQYPQSGIPSEISLGNALWRFPGLSNKALIGCVSAPPEGVKGRPRVVATFPARGAVVRPGLVVVRVTFDQPMSCDASFDGTSDLPNPCPGRWREATLSQDRRSFRTVCEVRSGARYRLTLRSFRNTHGLAIPLDVIVSTSGAASVATVREALAEDIGAPVSAGG